MTNSVQIHAENAQDLTHKETLLGHNFADNILFTDGQLALLIDLAREHGPQHYTLGALNEDGYGDKWQNGVIGDMSGADVLQAIKNGRLWLQLQGLREMAPHYHSIAEEAFRQLKQANKDFSYHNLTSNLLISSPAARVLCHLDCAEVILWHIRGRKRVYLYDMDKIEFCADETIEKVILRESEEEIAYRREWDEVASIYDLEPGQAANWPHFWPHRVDNISDLNVSLQTEFYSKKGIREYGIRFANGLLRRRAGITPAPVKTTGLGALAKTGMGLMAKKLRLNSPIERKIKSQFTIDPAKNGSICQLDRSQQTVLAK